LQEKQKIGLRELRTSEGGAAHHAPAVFNSALPTQLRKPAKKLLVHECVYTWVSAYDVMYLVPAD